jgi:signal transduction histidine kinase
MATIVNTVLKRLNDVIKEHQADIILPDNWPVALGYSPWVEEVWANYVSNAIEYGGSPPRVELGATPEEDDTIRFWVRDNGPGLAFDEQVESLAPSGQRAQERGLGLVVVRRIMEKLGRKASVESTEGQGNIYSFTLRGA